MELYKCSECFTMNGEFANHHLCIECAVELECWLNGCLDAEKEGWYCEEEPDLSQLEEVLS